MGQSKKTNGSEKSVELPEVDVHTPVADLQPVVTPDGLGYVAIGGRIYAWDPQNQKWNQSRTENIKQLKLGADSRLYALTENNKVLALNPDGEPLTDRPAIQLPDGVRDFAVSPMGTIAFVDDDPEARIGFLDPANASDKPLAPIRGNSPIPAAGADKGTALRSLAFSQDGSVSVLDNAGMVWAGSRPTSTSNLNWVQVRAALTEKLAAYNKLERLVTLRNGSVGGVDQQQNILERSGGTWHPVDFQEKRAVDTFYDKVEKLETGDGRKWYVPAIFHREGSEPTLSERWRQWRKAHTRLQQQTRGAYANASQELRNELILDQSQLSNAETLPKLEDLPWKAAEAFESAIANKVTDNAKNILDELEQELGIRNPDGTINKDFRNKKVQASPATVNSDQNVIKQLYDVRRAVCGEEDAVTARFKALLDQNVFLHIDSKRQMVDAGVNNPLSPGHLVKNKWGVLTGKMVHDHAVLAEAARAANDSQEPASEKEILQWAELIDGSSEENRNQISTLYNANYKNLDRADRALEAYDHVTAALKSSHRLNRAATAQGAMGPGALADSYIKTLHSMKPGESISLQSSGGGMLSFFGVSPLMINWLVPFVQLQGFVEASAKRTHGLTLTKTEEGVEFSINKSTEVAGTPLGFRVRAGLFASEKLWAIAQAFFYAGGQNISKLGVVKNFENATTFTIKQDDQGRLQGALRGVFEGTMSPYELMETSEEVRNKRDVKLTTTLTTTFEAGIGAGGGGNSANATSQAKHALAPAAERFIVGGQWEKGRSSEYGPNGARTTRRLSQAEAFVKATHATDLPGFAQQFDKDLWGNSVRSDGYSLNVGEKGDVKSVTVEVRPKRLTINSLFSRLKGKNANSALTEKHVPQLGALLKTNPELQAHIDKLRKSEKRRKSDQSGESATTFKIEMEFTPAALEQIREYIAKDGKRPHDEDVHKFVKALGDKPENLRIKDLSVMQETTYTTGWTLALPVFGYQSTATNTGQRELANIKVTYPDSGEKPTVKIRGDLLLGAEALPDFSQVNDILRKIDPERYEFLNNPVRDNVVRQQLAQITGSVESNQTAAAEKLFASSTIDRDGVGLLNGRLVYTKKSDDIATSRIIDLPADISSRIIGQLGCTALAPMSQGETGVLRSEMLPLTPDDLSRLDQLVADPATPDVSHNSVKKDSQRSLSVNGIIDDLRSGNLPKLDPAQEIILAQFFPDADGRLDLKELGRLLDDRAQVERFQASIRNFAESINPAILLDSRQNSSNPPEYKDVVVLPIYSKKQRDTEVVLDEGPPSYEQSNARDSSPRPSEPALRQTPQTATPMPPMPPTQLTPPLPPQQTISEPINQSQRNKVVPEPTPKDIPTSLDLTAPPAPARDLKREPGFKDALAAEMKKQGLTQATMPKPSTPEMNALMDGVGKRLNRRMTLTPPASSIQPEHPAQTPPLPQLRSLAPEPTQVPTPSLKPTPGFGQVKATGQGIERQLDLTIVLDMISKENPKLIPPGNVMDAKMGDSLDRMPGFKPSTDSKVMFSNNKTGDAYVWIPPPPDRVTRKADVYVVNASLQDKMLGMGNRLAPNQSTKGMQAGIEIGQGIEQPAPSRSSSKNKRF
ncbi:MAG TPA: AvrE-family type 3 secretion system effector [Burkholderiales bacterium]|nr:AvrE-family type 3 secretion system effector [Burkholderiales bacterium]